MKSTYVYTLEHRGEKFRMHGITSVVANSALSCNVCKKRFALDAVVALLNSYVDGHPLCRDITCCQTIECQTIGHMNTIVYLPTALAANQRELLSDKPTDERAPPAVCRWCKGEREITVNFKTKPCECVKQDGTAGLFAGTDDIGRGWEVKKTFKVA